MRSGDMLSSLSLYIFIFLAHRIKCKFTQNVDCFNFSSSYLFFDVEIFLDGYKYISHNMLKYRINTVNRDETEVWFQFSQINFPFPVNRDIEKVLENNIIQRVIYIKQNWLWRGKSNRPCSYILNKKGIKLHNKHHLHLLPCRPKARNYYETQWFDAFFPSFSASFLMKNWILITEPWNERI